jgi:hypothetical protein
MRFQNGQVESSRSVNQGHVALEAERGADVHDKAAGRISVLCCSVEQQDKTSLSSLHGYDDTCYPLYKGIVRWTSRVVRQKDAVKHVEMVASTHRAHDIIFGPSYRLYLLGVHSTVVYPRTRHARNMSCALSSRDPTVLIGSLILFGSP